MYFAGEPSHRRRVLILQAMPLDQFMSTHDICVKLDARCRHPDYYDVELMYATLIGLERKGWLDRSPPSPMARGKKVEWRKIKEFEA